MADYLFQPGHTMPGEDIFSRSRLVRNFDWGLLGAAIAITLVGVLMIYSANLQGTSEYMSTLYWRQLTWMVYGLAGLVAFVWLDYHTLERFAYPIYALCILLLVLVLIKGRIIAGSQRWLGFAGVNIQPSELMKIALILALAKYFSMRSTTGSFGLLDLLKPLPLALAPFLLIAKQPDLGTATIMLIIFFAMAAMNGIKPRLWFRMSIAGAIMAPVAWLMLKDYQRNRILTVLNPEADPKGLGYHTIQSKIAIGSGGFWGKGLFAGTQSKLDFLPEKHTDFIFAVLAEELGFIGSMALFLLYFVFLAKMVSIVGRAKDSTGTMIALGITVMFSFHALYNIGMTMGIFPIVGITLPMMSYGGSSLFANFLALGLLLNIHMRRFQNA